MKNRLLSLAMALCMVLSLLPATAFADENAETPVCICEEACTAEDMDAECPVCGAEGAVVENCGKYMAPVVEEQVEEVVQMGAPAGEEPELTAVEKVQAMIDALPTVEELEDADDETVDAAYAAVQDVYDALDELSEEELDQITGLDKLAALLEWFTGPVSTYDEGDFNYTLDKTTGTITITKYTGSDVYVVIPDKIDGKTVTAIGANAFGSCTSLESVTIPSSVTSIGEDAFYFCKSIKSIEIPNSVTSIGARAFAFCYSLASISLPDGVTSIGSNAFYDCRSLKSIIIPNGVTSIGDYVFQQCGSLTSVTLPDSVTSIGDGAFRYCPELKSINIPNSVKSIGGSAFEDCYRLENITIPDGVTSIGSCAFYGCDGLTSITIPGSVTLGNRVFLWCDSLISVNIQNGITSIPEGAFSYCRNLKSIEIPSSVTSVGVNAFYDCKSLESIFLPEGLVVTSASIPNTTSQVRYRLDTSKREVTITEIDLGTDKKGVVIPATICSYPVVAAADGLLDKIGAHTCAGGKATCQEEAVCGICNQKYGNKEEHVYEWQSGNGQYWKKCKNCGDETAKKDIPTITINGADTVCVTQDYKFSFTLPEGTADAVYGYEFENKGDLGFKPVIENNELNGVVSAAWYEPGENSFKVYAGAKTADGFEFFVSKTVAILSGHIDAEPKDHSCDICGAALSGHTGGEATCTSKAVCEYCGKAYGDLDPDNHVGGKATCTSKAVCEYCGNEYGEINSSNHNLEKVAAKEATVTETGNSEYWHCKDCGNNFSDAAGKSAIELKDTVIAKLAPEIIEGKGQSITAGEKKALTFRSNAAFSDFIRVELDGKTLDGKNYTVKEGSTIVTLKADYVATLSAGKHTISIVSTSGTAATTFTVNKKAAAVNAPKTGDNSHIALWIALLVVSGGLMTVLGVYIKKKKRSAR